MDDDTLYVLIAAVRWDDSHDYPGGDLAWPRDRRVAEHNAFIGRIADNGIRFTLQGDGVPYREDLFRWTLDDYLYFTDKSLLWRLPWRLLEQQDVNTLTLLGKEDWSDAE